MWGCRSSMLLLCVAFNLFPAFRKNLPYLPSRSHRPSKMNSKRRISITLAAHGDKPQDLNSQHRLRETPYLSVPSVTELSGSNACS